MAAAAAGGLLAALVAPAYSQVPRNLGDVLRDSPNANNNTAPTVGRYDPEQGPEFVLDRSNGAPLLRFEDSSEVWVLKPRPTGRGDIVYVNDAGRVVLRATRLGGLILFTDGRPQGVPVALKGAALPLPTQLTMSPTAFLRRMQEALLRLERVLRRENVTIQFKTDQSAAPLVADAAKLAVDAVEQTIRSPGGSALMVKLVKVVLNDGTAPSVAYEEGVLSITVNPDLGLAGRPSSERIRRTLLGAI